MAINNGRQLHFGVLVVANKYGLRLTKENYAIINNRPSFSPGLSCFDTVEFIETMDNKYVIDETKTIGNRHFVTKRHYTDSWCQQHYENCIKNFDMNMAFYASLDKALFERKLQSFLKKHTGFKRVTDLKEYDSQSGYYLMVLDEYKQVYIGTSDNIKKRIQTHWRTQKEFDRLLFGTVENSRLSIDSFRALDTTRIYAYITQNTYHREDKYIRFFPDAYVCNRIAGGNMELGTLEAYSTRKERTFQESSVVK